MIIKQKDNSGKVYLYTMMKVQLVVGQQIFQCPQIIQNVILFMAMCQSLSFIYTPILEQTRTQNDKFNLLNYITNISRFDVILDQFAKVEEQQVFMIPLITIIFFQCGVLQILTYILYKNRSSQVSIKDQINIKYTILRGVIMIYSYYLQLFPKILFLPFQVMAFLSFHENFEQDQIAGVLLSILTIILLYLNQIQIIILNTETINLRIQGFEKLELSSTEILISLIIALQIIVYFIIEDIETGFGIQIGLNISYIILQIFSIFFLKLIVIKSHQQTILISVCFSLVFTLGQAFIQPNVYLVICPLFVGIIWKLYLWYEQNTIIEILYQKNSQNMKYHIALIVNNQIQKSETVFALQQVIVAQNHTNKCKIDNCYCKKSYTQFEDPKELALLNDRMKLKFYIKKLRTLNYELNQKKQSMSYNHYLHYISALNYFGQTTAAFQQCNMFLYSTKTTQQKNVDYNSSQLYSRTFRSEGSSSQTNEKIQTHIQNMNMKQAKKSQKNIVRFSDSGIGDFMRIRFEILQQEIRSKMQMMFMANQDDQQQQVAEAVMLFLQSEEKHQGLKSQIIKLLQLKLQFYQYIQQKNKLHGADLFKKSQKICHQITKTEKNLQIEYESFPSQKLQSIMAFLQSEILNNYIKAFRIANFSTISDEKLINMRRNIKVNLFAKNVTYMIVQISESFKSLSIQSRSNNCHEFFEYDFQEFQKQNVIDFLLPDSVVREHMIFVQKFIQSGTSKFFRSQNQSYLKLSNGFIKPMNFFFDLNTTQKQELTFAVFFEEAQSLSSYLLVDVDGNVSGYSKRILEIIGFKGYKYPEAQLTVPINCLINNFEQIVEENIGKGFNHTIYILKPNFYDTNTSLVTEKRRQTLDLWSNHSNLIQLDCNIQVHRKELFGYYIYFIQIDDIRVIKNLEDNKTDFEMRKKEQLQLNEFNDIDSNRQSYSNIAITEEEQLPHKPNNVDYQEINLKNDIQYLNSPNNDDSKLKDFSISVMTPHQSHLISNRLMESAKNRPLQLFFQKENDEEESYSEKELKQEQKQNNKLDFDYDVNKGDREMQENVRMQLNMNDDKENQFIEDQASQVSSLAGIRKSLFYKKYNIIDLVIASSVMPSAFRVVKFIWTLYFFLTIIFFILALVNINNDLLRFKQEIEMIQFYQQFMGPVEIFLAMRLQILMYNTMNTQRLINSTAYNQYYSWIFNRFPQNFYDLKNNFVTSLTNPYLQEFFTDQYFQVRLQRYNSSDLETKNTTFRETLFILINYQHQFMIAYVDSRQFGGMPMQTYLYANYLSLHYKFGNTTQDILFYTENRKTQVQQRWWQQWIGFFAAAMFLNSLCYYFYLKFKNNYEVYIEFFKHVDPFYMERDMERFKIILTMLQKDQNIMFNYQFDLDRKEKSIVSEKLKKELQVKNAKVKRQTNLESNKLPFLVSFLVYSIIFALYFTFSFIISFQTSSYLDKYQKTSETFYSLCNIQKDIPAVYSQKYMLFFLGGFTYLTPSNRQEVIFMMFKFLGELRDFSRLTEDFDESTYLTNQRFIKTLNYAKKSNVCDILSKEERSLVNFYCTFAYQGSLLQGLDQSFAYIINSIKTEYQINNFTTRREYPLFDIEGSYVVMRTVELLVSLMKSGMITATDQQILQTNTLSILYICFAVIILLFGHTYVSDYLFYNFNQVKKFLHLLPSATLFLDDILERQLRIYQAKENSE